MHETSARTNKADIDPLRRNQTDGADCKTNPYDLYALEAALRLREENGGTVTVVTMGPPQAAQVIREAYSMGADHGVLVSDRCFAGSDVLATSMALSQAIKTLGGFDLILCGKQTTDGAPHSRLKSGVFVFRRQPINKIFG